MPKEIYLSEYTPRGEKADSDSMLLSTAASLSSSTIATMRDFLLSAFGVSNWMEVVVVVALLDLLKKDFR